MKRNKVETNGVTERHQSNGDCQKENGEKTNDTKGNCEKLYKKFYDLKQKAISDGLTKEEVCDVFRGKVIKEPGWVLHLTVPQLVALSLAVAVAVMAVAGGVIKYFELDEELTHLIRESRCIVDNSGFMIEIARPKTNCNMCKNLKSVPIETNITRDIFAEKYAYTAVPVLIKHATLDWTAMGNFSFHFFQDLYKNTKGALDKVEDECQFFPYKTEFDSLGEVFNMSDDRATFKEGEKPWYIGWSNCHNDVAKVLRQHYQRPFFIPSDSESSSIDWIFMGGTGLGAFVHLDYVQRPSWQAQISGEKTWTLIPTPECEHVCYSMNVTVSKGDIIVLDTNQWYHATFIHPGEISITIGSEYD
ncbi:hypothetical protein FSP39_010199 [Pinctada imbricata]|uniref:Cupin-like domain-containing protein n=1 Tax=Pinctada imbricata TaxID=66713 RepID=A0AA88XXI0_PINIB|nr:hypothetical protein FSP39_010199 [Pinctada imbricata]